jgi:chemotaxis protein CheX
MIDRHMAKTVDVQLVNPFLVATLDCMTVMGGLQPERRRLFLKTSPIMHGEVAGVIGLSRANGGGNITGSVVVSFPDSLARRIVSRLVNEPPETLAKDMVLDGIGEVANMVGGGAKRLLAGGPYRFEISTPTVLAGHNVNLYNPPDTVSIACEFLAHPQWTETFMIELAVKPVNR